MQAVAIREVRYVELPAIDPTEVGNTVVESERINSVLRDFPGWTYIALAESPMGATGQAVLIGRPERVL